MTMVCVAAQIWPGLRRRHPRAAPGVPDAPSVAMAIPAAVRAMVIGAATLLGPVLSVSNVALGALVAVVHRRLACRGGAAAPVRERIGARCCAVRRWRCRSSPTESGPRSLYLGFEPLRDSASRRNEEGYVWFVAGVGGWLGWTIPLLLLQLWMRRRPGMGGPLTGLGEREATPTAPSVSR